MRNSSFVPEEIKKSKKSGAARCLSVATESKVLSSLPLICFSFSAPKVSCHLVGARDLHCVYRAEAMSR